MTLVEALISDLHFAFRLSGWTWICQSRATMGFEGNDSDDLKKASSPEAFGAQHRISIVDPLAFGECSPVAKQWPSPPLPSSSRSPDPKMMIQTIENSSIPSTAKRVLLRFEQYSPDIREATDAATFSSSSSMPYPSTITPMNRMLEQTRSMTLIQKLRQSAFRRKMNSSVDVLSSSFTSSADPPSVSTQPASQGASASKLVTVTEAIPDLTLENKELETLPHTLVVGRLDGGGTLEILRPHPSMERHAQAVMTKAATSPRIPSIDCDPETALHPNASPVPSKEESERNNPEQSIQAYSLHSDTLPKTRFDHITHSTLELGASSMAFMQQIRGAAFRRKKTLARSRDSLMEKERLHRESIAKVAQQQLEAAAALALQTNVAKVPPMASFSHVQPFKALPLPKTTGWQGSFGLSGVPKVPKRLPTIPKSPALGPRRFVSVENGNRPCVPSNSSETTISSFKALPLPKSSSEVGGAGQAGVPKVAKRKVTIPLSPPLGLLRRPPPKASTNASVPDSNDAILCHAKDKSSLLPSESDSSSVVFVGTVDCHCKENENPTSMVLRPSAAAFIPRSSRRAEQRAAFEMQRAQNEQLRHEAERRARLQQVHLLQKELDVLRIEI